MRWQVSGLVVVLAACEADLVSEPDDPMDDAGSGDSGDSRPWDDADTGEPEGDTSDAADDPVVGGGACSEVSVDRSEVPAAAELLDCTTERCGLSGTIAEDMRLTADHTWLLQGAVHVGSRGEPVTLVIEPGARIEASSAADTVLVVQADSRLLSLGTAEAPVVFTSDEAEGERERGDWGGLAVLGHAPQNDCDTSNEDCVSIAIGGVGIYGGSDGSHDSGAICYTRIEFAGEAVGGDDALPGLGLYGVGSGTVVDAVQVHMADGDGVALFGGSVHLEHLLITGAGGDGLDWAHGWRGGGQFIAIQQHADAGDNAVEADNNTRDMELAPLSEPTLANLTLVGSPSSEFSDYGLALRSGTGMHLYDSVVQGFNEACVDLDDTATFDHVADGALTTAGVLLQECDNPIRQDGESFDDDLNPWFLSCEGNQMAGNAELGDPYDEDAPDLRTLEGPTPTSGAGGDFERPDFVGAISWDDDWTAGWTATPAD